MYYQNKPLSNGRQRLAAAVLALIVVLGMGFVADRAIAGMSKGNSAVEQTER